LTSALFKPDGQNQFANTHVSLAVVAAKRSRVAIVTKHPAIRSLSTGENSVVCACVCVHYGVR
jgi:hypothetical protein